MIFKTENIQDMLERELIGKKARANHPQTTFNPEEVFEIKHVSFEIEGKNIIVKVRGDNTCWFGRHYWKLVD